MIAHKATIFENHGSIFIDDGAAKIFLECTVDDGRIRKCVQHASAIAKIAPFTISKLDNKAVQNRRIILSFVVEEDMVCKSARL